MNREELEERTLRFSKNLIAVLQKLPKNLISHNLIGQTVRSGTSVGANYREANAAESEKDFKHKMNISFKEAKEARYWLDILMSANPDHKNDLAPLRQESDELARIFGKAVTSCRKNAKSEMRNAK